MSPRPDATRRPVPPPQARADRAPAVRLESQSLLRGGREAIIVHQGEEYRLRLTRLDKLILTK